MEEEMKQVNVQMPGELQEMLDEMVKEDESDRSKFIRKLIRQEYARRQQLSLFPPEQPKKKTHPRIRAARVESLAA